MSLSAHLLLVAGAFAGQSDGAVSPRTAPAVSSPDQTEPAVADEPLAEHRLELLDLARAIASSLPEFPHVKDRSREEEAVVGALLELGQPSRAQDLAGAILNWRRGAALADCAFYYAERGDETEAERLLALADEVARWPEERIKQSWRRDRVRSRIARAYTRLGRGDDAARYVVDGLEDSEWGGVEAVQASLVEQDEFDAWFKSIDRVFVDGSFDQMRNACFVLAEAYGTNFPDEKRRARLEATIRGAWDKLPPQVHFDLMHILANHALEHGDEAKARGLAAEARDVFRGVRFTAEVHVANAVRLAELRYRAGDREAARADADAALATYQQEREKIIDVFRTEALVPLAEAYATMDAKQTALAVYELAASEAIVNPNSRPRVEDLGAICRSMALRDVAPSEALWSLLREVSATLGREYENL